MNALYGSKAYENWKNKCYAIFTPESRFPEDDRVKELTDGFSVRYRAYRGNFEKYTVTVGENELLDCDGNVFFAWRCIYHSGIHKIIHHSNGHRYFIFRTDLYGYSVLDMDTKEEFHYVPAESYNEVVEKIEETFIWVVPHYDPQSDLLAVEGCIWACPYSVIVVDFSAPMKEQSAKRWFDIAEFLDLDYEDFNDIDFVRWENGNLCLKIENDDRTYKEVVITEKQIRDFINNASKSLQTE